MKHGILWAGTLILLAACPSFVNAGTIVPGDSQLNSIVYSTFAPEAVKTMNAALPQTAQADTGDKAPQTAPSKSKAKKEDSAPVQKSTRKAFFLSMLMPGLGEYYVGSKRGFLFLGIEAVAWYIYVSNTSKGNDLDTKFKSFADAHWNYADTTGVEVYNYFNWFKAQLIKNNLPADISPRNYALIDALTDSLKQIGKSGVTETLPSDKTQQYYEMIGKYPQFVYGWEDIEKNNINLSKEGTKGYPNFDEKIEGDNIKSPMRNQYMDMRKQSNDKLKLGQDGIELMLINRVVSAIDAARLAYHHNKKIDSELSMVRMNIVQKKINDRKVPMLMFTKKF